MTHPQGNRRALYPKLRRLARVVLGPAAVCVLATACGTASSAPARSGSSPPPASASSAGSPVASSPAPAGHKVTVRARSLPDVGTVLVDGQGYALYMFIPDHRREVTCTSICAATWPPLKLPAGTSPVTGSGLKSSLLGSDADPAGGRVVTYDGWPLYTYTGDVQPGQTTGQGIDLNGGLWYLLRPSGTPLTPAVQ